MAIYPLTVLKLTDHRSTLLLSTLNLRHTSEAIATVEVLSFNSDFDCSAKINKMLIILNLSLI